LPVPLSPCKPARPESCLLCPRTPLTHGGARAQVRRASLQVLKRVFVRWRDMPLVARAPAEERCPEKPSPACRAPVGSTPCSGATPSARGGVRSCSGIALDLPSIQLASRASSSCYYGVSLHKRGAKRCRSDVLLIKPVLYMIRSLALRLTYRTGPQGQLRETEGALPFIGSDHRARRERSTPPRRLAPPLGLLFSSRSSRRQNARRGRVCPEPAQA